MQMIHPNPDSKREEICITSVAGLLFGGMTVVPFVKLLIEVLLQEVCTFTTATQSQLSQGFTFANLNDQECLINGVKSL